MHRLQLIHTHLQALMLKEHQEAHSKVAEAHAKLEEEHQEAKEDHAVEQV